MRCKSLQQYSGIDCGSSVCVVSGLLALRLKIIVLVRGFIIFHTGLLDPGCYDVGFLLKTQLILIHYP